MKRMLVLGSHVQQLACLSASQGEHVLFAITDSGELQSWVRCHNHKKKGPSTNAEQLLGRLVSKQAPSHTPAEVVLGTSGGAADVACGESFLLTVVSVS